MTKIPYYIALFIPVLLLSFHPKTKVKKEAYLIVFLFYFLLAINRGNGSGDYFNYYNAVHLMQKFENVISPGKYPFEIGFRLISYLNNLLLVTPQFTILSLNIISFLTITYAIKKHSRHPLQSALLYYPFLLIYDMHHTRSAVAMNFTVLFFFLLYEKKYFKSLMISILAISFHKSSLVPILIICFYYIFAYFRKIELFKFSSSKIRKHASIIIILILIIIVTVIRPTQVIISITNLLRLSTISKKLTSYLANERWSYPFSLFDPRFILLLIVYVYSKFILTSDKTTEKLYIYMLDMVLIAVLIVISLSESTMFTMRMYNYFNLFTVFLLPYVFIKSEKINNKYRLINYALLAIYILYYVLLAHQQVDYIFYLSRYF